MSVTSGSVNTALPHSGTSVIGHMALMLLVSSSTADELSDIVALKPTSLLPSRSNVLQSSSGHGDES